MIDSKALPLQSYLIQPVQRCPRYVLLLKVLCAFFPLFLSLSIFSIFSFSLFELVFFLRTHWIILQLLIRIGTRIGLLTQNMRKLLRPSILRKRRTNILKQLLTFKGKFLSFLSNSPSHRFSLFVLTNFPSLNKIKPFSNRQISENFLNLAEPGRKFIHSGGILLKSGAKPVNITHLQQGVQISGEDVVGHMFLFSDLLLLTSEIPKGLLSNHIYKFEGSLVLDNLEIVDIPSNEHCFGSLSLLNLSLTFCLSLFLILKSSNPQILKFLSRIQI